MDNKQPEKVTKHIDRKKKNNRTFADWIELVTEILEIAVAVIVLCGFVISAVPLIRDMPGLLSNENTYTFHVFLEHAFNLVIGIEFIRMLIRHTPGSALKVLLFAIARHIVLDGSSGTDLLLGVASIAGIFAIRKYLYVHSFEPDRDDGEFHRIRTGDENDSDGDSDENCQYHSE